MSTMGYFLSLLLCAAVVSMTQGFSQEDLREAMLEQLGLAELPRIQKRDLEDLVIPTHVKNKYLSMLRLHNTRRRRSLPSLAGILRGIHGSADISGEIMYSDTTRQRMDFDMTDRVPDGSEVTMAELKLYQTVTPTRPVAGRRHHRPVHNARASIYWVEVLADGSNRTSLVDSRLVPIQETGWRSFDVTQAVHYWSKTQTDAPLHLEVWIEGERPGSYAAERARSVRFTTQDPVLEGTHEQILRKPELVLYTLNMDEYGSRGDCRSGEANGMCCREEHFINFRELTWTQFWIIEPAGYQAYRCAGGCKQPKRTHAHGQRTCAPIESAPLPMMYLVKKGDHTEIEVAEFPNMIVEKCGCIVDNTYS